MGMFSRPQEQSPSMSTTTPSVKGSPRTAPAAPRGRALRGDIQGLRAVAVLAVFAEHLLGRPLGGFTGVDMFLVISGFLITGLLIREHERTGTISFTGFYRRRIKRILPASTLVIAVTLVASVLLLPATRAQAVVADGAWALLFSANWRFALSGTDYFNDGTLPSPLRHFWSLGVEEQFYFLWPWLMLGLLLLLSRRSGGGLSDSRRRAALAIAMGVLVCASLAWAAHETLAQPTWAYFSTLSRAWELGVGALLAVAVPLLERLPDRVRPVLAWAGILALAASVVWVDASRGGFPWPWALLPVLGVAAVIAAGTGGSVPAPRLLDNRVAGYVGDLSYSLYLWHWPVIVLLPAFLATDTPLFWTVCVVLAFGLSIASYHAVENPLRRATWFPPLSAGPAGGARRIATVGAVAALLAVVVGTAVTADQRVASSHSGISAAALRQPHARECLGAGSHGREQDCAAVLGETLVPGLDLYPDDVQGAFACWKPRDHDRFPDCVLGDPDGERTVALVGDSHAASLLPALEPLATERGWRLRVYTGLGCTWYEKRGPSACGDALEAAMAEITAPGAVDAVIVSANRSERAHGYAERLDRTIAAWREVAAQDRPVIAVSDVPAVAEQALQCLGRVGFDPAQDDCGTPREEALATGDTLLGAAEAVDHAWAVDLTPLLCDDSLCRSVIGNTVVYRDTNGHMTASFAQTLVPFLEEELVPRVEGAGR
jgi:peptidoglycan/LPS O-acetylase OafA/YrhL